MDSITVVGASFRRGGSDLLARYTIPREVRLQQLPQLAAALGVPELVYLATCNRVELILRSSDPQESTGWRRRIFEYFEGRPPAPGEAERRLRAWAGEGAIEHVLLVACGLDSAQVGEREVRTQVLEAVRQSREAGVLGPTLDTVCGEALRLASELHDELEPADARTSLADVAAELVLRRLQHTPGRVALIGVSPMTRQSASRLAARGHEVIVVNRSEERARELAQRYGWSTRGLEDFCANPDSLEALIVATGATEAILGRPELEKLAAQTPSGEPILCVDLATPANIDRDAARSVGVELVDLDTINAEAERSRRQRLLELGPARELVDATLERLVRTFAEREVAPVLGRLNRRYRQTAATGVERLLRKHLRNLDETEAEAVRRWAAVMAQRFAHIPTLGLRALAAEHGLAAVHTFLDASGEDFFGKELP